MPPSGGRGSRAIASPLDPLRYIAIVRTTTQWPLFLDAQRSRSAPVSNGGVCGVRYPVPLTPGATQTGSQRRSSRRNVSNAPVQTCPDAIVSERRAGSATMANRIVEPSSPSAGIRMDADALRLRLVVREDRDEARHRRLRRPDEGRRARVAPEAAGRRPGTSPRRPRGRARGSCGRSRPSPRPVTPSSRRRGLPHRGTPADRSSRRHVRAASRVPSRRRHPAHRARRAPRAPSGCRSRSSRADSDMRRPS